MIVIEIINELNVVSISIRVALSLFIGGILGLERGRKRHPAGFRTYMLVCLGSASVMMTNQFIINQYGGGDPARLGAQVVSGIGFLGAGTIIVTKRNQVRGLTTAAGLWTAACLGLAIGIGFYEGAIIVGFVVLLIMTAFQKLDNWIVSKDRYLNICVTFATIESFHEFMAYSRSHDIKIHNMEMSKEKISKQSGLIAILMLEILKQKEHLEILEEISSLTGVSHVEEI